MWAQTSGGTFSGKITAASGSPIPNATVTITNVQTNYSQKVLSGPDGNFVVSNLPPGTYSMQVETTGYKRASKQNVELSATGGAIANVTLEAGPSDQIVEIKGTSPVVQSDGADVSVGYGTRTVRELPVIDRNHQEIAGLQSGITPPQPALDFVRDPDRNRFFSTNGQMPASNEFRMEGVNNLEPYRGTAVRVQPTENVQELMVETSNLRADRGFAAGALVTDVTRAGTNDWHGGLYEFYSGNILRTRNPFNTANNPDPRFAHNNMGANFGGPIVRDRTFFFGSWEGLFDNGSLTQVSTVPTAQAMGGNFGAIPGLTLYNPTTGINGAGRTVYAGGIIPANQINRTAAAFASFFPAANQAGFTNNLVSNSPFRNHDNRIDARIDQNIGDRTRAFVRWGYTNDWSFQASPFGNVIGTATRGRLLGQNAVAGIVHEFGPSVVTDFRVGYNRYDQKINAYGDPSALGSALGVSGSSLIGVNIAGFGSLGAPSFVPEHPVDNNFNFVWTWGLHRSIHNATFGADVRRFRTDGFRESAFGSGFGPNGTAYFGPGATMSSNGPALSQYGEMYNAFAAFLTGAPSQIGISNYFVNPSIRQTQYAFFAADRIQIMRRLTLDLGVRYDVYSPLQPANAGGAQFFNASNNTFNYAGIGSTGMNFSQYDRNSIAPRIGLAFRATQKTVIRAGYGINYFQTPYMYSGFQAPTYGSVIGVQGGFTTASLTGGFGPVFNNAPAAPASLQNGAAAGNQQGNVLLSRYNNPYVQTLNFQVQQEFYGGTVLALGYVGALDRQLPFVQELNAALPGTGVAGLPFAGIGRTGSTLAFDSGLTSNYNSLQVTLNKRFSQGLSFSASYTYAKALGYTTANGFLLNPFQRSANYGPLDYDRQHVLTIGHLWDLPLGRKGGNMISTILGGWQVNGVFTWDSGTPLTVTADPVSCACPGNTVLASVNGSAFLNNGTSILNPGAFSAPPAGQFGNLGRSGLRGPGSRNYNLSLLKHFRVRERFNMELRGEAYNLTNSPRFASPVTNINSPNFGQEVSTVNGSYGRQVNLGFRATF